MNDRRKIQLLAGDLLAYLPQPRQSSDLLRGSAGLAAGRRVPCESCGARGRLTDKGQPCAACPPRVGPAAPPVHQAAHGCHGCPVCEGFGWRKARKADRGFDEYAGVAVDEHEDDNRPAGEILLELARGFGRADEMRARDVAHRRSEAQMQRWSFERGEIDNPKTDESWLEHQRWMRGTGSYRELERALESMRAKMPERVRIWWRVYVLEEEIRFNQAGLDLLDETSDMIATRMPKPIKVPPHLEEEEINRLRKESLWRGQTPAHGSQRSERDRHILKLFEEEGWTKARIGRFYNLERERVRQIIDRQQAKGGVPTGASA